ncbi:hypothetical protein CONCODRAFT_79525 [Conidiobolus coronatus NRRL 28638]|uniref:Uncharacterized protein n=1 Tax=Conidiobolus coronatus (strain ATCC 28846 / CBS 209.66 / NRRL 28638) TaxID=796925 RepID=A0A137P2B1_CONC2|nr:hypothetical protein CONCODRAFT_79525 [Conidiobolus coronatus NRRL 28638]|eukprot:KXN69031.1 hypothetical protein CONCODRAFT_79525 [Conidiobolus coronatus NRRL 28638]
MKPNTPKLEIQAVCVNCCPYKSDFELPPLKKEFLECGFGVSETIFTSYLDIPSKIQQLAMSHWDLYSIDLIRGSDWPPLDSTEKRLKIDEALQSKDLSILSRFNYCRALNAPHIDHRIHWSDPNYLASRSIKMYLGTNPNFDTSLPLTQCIHKLCYRDLDESYGHDILKPLVDLSQPYYLLQDETSHNDEDIYMHQYMIKKDGDYLTIHCLLQVFQDKQQESPQAKPSATEADYIGWDVFKRDFIQASMPNSSNMIDLIESAESINDADKQPFLVTALIPQNQTIEINSQIASKLPLTTTFMNNYIWWETNLICEEEDSSEYIRFIQQNRSLHLLKSSILSPKEFNAFEIDTTLDLFSKCFLSLPKVSSYDPDNLDKTEPPLLLFIRMPYLLQRLYNSFPHCRQLIPHMVSTLVTLLNNLSDLFHQLGILLPYQVDQIKKNYVPNPTRMKKHFTQHLIQNWNPVHTKLPTDAIALYHLHYHQFQKECPSLFFASGPCPLSIKTQHGSFDGLEWLKILMSISPTAD